MAGVGNSLCLVIYAISYDFFFFLCCFQVVANVLFISSSLHFPYDFVYSMTLDALNNAEIILSLQAEKRFVGRGVRHRSAR